jgi:predicted P-loop ATPase
MKPEAVAFGQSERAKINLDGLRRIRDQLRAEAQEHYAAGAPWWMENADVDRAENEEQAGRDAGDTWDEGIQQLKKSDNDLSIGQILTAVGVETGRQTQCEMNRVARCLKALGWTRVQVGVGRERRWIYRKGRDQR